MPEYVFATTANVQIGDVIDPTGPWPRGRLLLAGYELSFLEKRGLQPVVLRLVEIHEASFSSSAITDEIVLTTYEGPLWAIRFCAGRDLVTALRARGVLVEE